MRSTICLAALLGLGLASRLNAADPAPNTLTISEQKSGWKLLFDGKSTDGWRNYQRSELSNGWKVQDGTLVRAAGGAGDIVTAEQYKYFELSLEYRISRGGNSGLMFHVTEDEPKPWQSGPEVQIQDNVDGHDPQKAGWLYQLYRPEKPAWAKAAEQQAGIETPDVDDATRPAGQWNRLYLRIAPKQSEVAVNGVSYYRFQKGSDDWNARVAKSKFAKFANFGKAESGHICLQDHGNEVAFRSIKLRLLDEQGAVAEPVDGELNVKSELAFPKLKWEGWNGVDAAGRVRGLRPMILTHAGDGSGRVFVATQRGAIYVFNKADQSPVAKMFLDLRERVADWKKNNEEGLLGFAFHPKFKENGQFFVYYSSAEEPHTSLVARFRVQKDDPQRADPASQEIVMRIPQPFSNHNGGSIAFGPDGYLYIGLGDGGGRNDPLANGQNLKTWMGSILRIDVDRRQGEQNYAVPSDNPFVNREGAKPEIYAYGLRNVWRLSFDRKTGDLWAADVGQDLWEEINLIKPGGNYGWNAREASHLFGNQEARDGEPIPPVWEYDHQVGKSITGGFVYRGALPELQGKYVYADYVSGKLWALEYDRNQGKALKNLAIPGPQATVLAFGEDEDGELYYLVESVRGESIYRFVK